MREKLAELLYPTIFKENENLRRELNLQRAEAQIELDHLKQLNDKIIHQRQIGDQVLSLQKTKETRKSKPHWVLTSLTKTSDTVYYFYIERAHLNSPVLSMLLDYIPEDNKIDLLDIQNINEESKGYGTIAMDYLLNTLTVELNINIITGIQRYKSEEQKKRQGNYYRSSGFKLENGRIIWKRKN